MLLIGFLISFVVAYGAYRRAALNLTGAMAAVAVGTVIFGLGGSMAGMALLGFFLTGTALSRYRKGIRAEDPDAAQRHGPALQGSALARLACRRRAGDHRQQRGGEREADRQGDGTEGHGSGQS